ncbi:MAG TPA: hypothetical protein VLA71_03130 [Algoriphagus sp.]|nr:hypothetical protein [Algoriphagus sp.]
MEADPELVGPENLCIVFGGVVGTFSGGGDPSTDVYTWLITGPNGAEIFNRSGGSQFETIKVSFNEIGVYSVNLSIRRNSDIILTESMSVRVQQGPELAILPDYLLCGNSPTEISAIKADTPNIDQYIFTWTDPSGNVVGNTNTISVTEEGYYKVELYLSGSSGQQECLISGSTYVGPSLDFNLQLSSESFCQGQSLSAGIDRPISGEWFLISPNSTEKTSLGIAYGVNLETEAIPEPGIYTLIFSATDPNFPDCKSERKATFEVLEGPELKVTLVEQPDNCSANNGNFEILTLSSMDSLIIVETGFKASAISENQNLSISNLEPQLYTIVAYANGCESVSIFNLESKNPPVTSPSTPEIFIPEIQIQEETCSPSGVEPGSVQVVFSQGEVTGEYRIIGQSKGALIVGNIQDQDTLTIPLQGGTYLLELKIEGCTYPVQEIIIPEKPQIEFTKPNQIIICESFEFVPETSQDLIFTLKFPDQSTQTLASGGSFLLTQPGEYELLGESTDPSSGLCPKTEKFTASISQPFSFGVSVFEEDCFGNQVFKADIEGFQPEETFIRWMNADGEIVGRGELLFAASVGDFSLIVQPLLSGSCPIQPVNFTVEAPVLQAEVLLEANKICPEPGTALIELTSDSVGVKTINWIFFDDSGNRRDLPEFDNLAEITIDAPGNYEAVVFNRIGCEIGRNFIKVENSTLLTLPVVEEVYGVCSRGQKGPIIEPGDFAEYYWYFEEELVSTDPQFSPKEAGDYNLKVVTTDSCEFFASFRTFDACSFEYAIPNAMVLGDPSRNFEVRISEGITEVELFIINRQGGLVHYQKSEEIPFGDAFLEWDGTTDGRYIPTGTYVVVLVGRNPLYQFEEKITGSLLVLE